MMEDLLIARKDNSKLKELIVEYGIKDLNDVHGFLEAIHAAFPKTEVQRCIIHQIRSSCRYVSYKDIKQFKADLKPVYKAPTEEKALAALDEFEAQ